MKWSKIITATIVIAIVRYIISSIFGGFFAEMYDPTTGLWRAMLTPTWIQNVIISHVLLAFLFVFTYVIVNTGLGKKKEWVKKGLLFGLIVWLLRDVTGAIMTYVFMPVSFALVSTWMVEGIISALINGLVIARLYR
jgi:hypothetical protein